MSELLNYRDKKFGELLRLVDVEQLKADASALEQEIARLGEERKSIDSSIGALQDAHRRLSRFLEQLSV